MYCVRCGVRLMNSVAKCPLCDTPVWNPDGTTTVKEIFPNRYPEEQSLLRLRFAIFCTLPFIVAELVMLIIWLNVAPDRRWGGVALLSIALAYVAFVYPMWFRKFYVFMWLAVLHAALEGYLLYISWAFGGSWFLSFAFPVVGIHGLLVTTVSALVRYMREGKLLILGGAAIAYGGYSMLIELFSHLTFGFAMFVWSIYSASVLFVIGLLLILTGMINPLRRYLHKLLFF